jgi:mono/diheme cytochrome c family protein
MRYPPVIAGAFVSMILFELGATAPPTRAAEQEQPGRQLYLRYCGACHGPQAKGDGIVGGLMQPSPPDLTSLASRHGGTFPLELVVKTIDGRELPRAHGEPAMPVWGQILSEELGSKGKPRPAVERRVQGRIYSIAEYLRSIQVK